MHTRREQSCAEDMLPFKGLLHSAASGAASPSLLPSPASAGSEQNGTIVSKLTAESKLIRDGRQIESVGGVRKPARCEVAVVSRLSQ